MKEIVIAILGAGALIGAILSFLQFIITRQDNKKNIEKKLNDKIDSVADDVKEVSDGVKLVSERLEEHKATLARTHILRFADELRIGTHSKEYFEQQLLDIDTYTAYCENHPNFANGLTKMASEYIKDEYKRQYLK